MKMELDVGDEFIDGVMENELTRAYKNIKLDIKNLKAKKIRKDYQDEDLIFLTELEKSFLQVCKYYIWNFEKKVKTK